MMQYSPMDYQQKCEDYFGGRYAKVSGTYSTGAVTITVTGAGPSSAYIFTVGDVIRNARTGENMLVATVPTSATITIASTGRSFGTTAAAAGQDGDGLYIVGNVNEENASARNMNMTRATAVTNYTQIHKATVGCSGTERESGLYGEKDIPYQRAKAAEEHALDIERSFLFGEKKSTTGSNSKPMRATGGVLEFLNTGNAFIQDQNGIPLTAPDFDTFLMNGFNYGSNEKVLFAGGKLLAAVNEFAQGKLQTVVGQSSYGVAIKKWISTFGTVNLIHHPLLINDYAGYGFLLDMSCFRYRYMNNRDTRLFTNVQAPDVDGEIDQYITECGLERNLAAKCALIKNVEF